MVDKIYRFGLFKKQKTGISIFFNKTYLLGKKKQKEETWQLVIDIKQNYIEYFGWIMKTEKRIKTE